MSTIFKCPNCSASIELVNEEDLQCKKCGKRYKNPKYQPETASVAPENKALAQVPAVENKVSADAVAKPVKNADNSSILHCAKEIALAIFKAENSPNALMTESQKGELLRHFSYYLPKKETGNFLLALDGVKQNKFALLMSYQAKSPLYTILFAICGGVFGMDRFYIGDKGAGVCKIIFGLLTFGLWYLIDIFATYKRCREKNLDALYALLSDAPAEAK